MIVARRWDLSGVPAIIVGCWINSLVMSSPTWRILIGVPALIIVAAGVSMILWRGDRRPAQYQAIAAVWIGLMALPSIFAIGWSAFGVFGLAILTLAISGWVGLRELPESDTAPRPEMTPIMALKAGLDQLVLALFQLLPRLAQPQDAPRIAKELETALEVYKKQGWDKNPAAFHKAPAAPESVDITEGNIAGHHHEFIRFPSDYSPHPDMPGSDRWQEFQSNRDVRGSLFRHAGDDRPWLLCIHGYGMGTAAIDFRLFDPNFLHHELGYNLVMMTLPLHGPRKASWLSGDHYFCGELLDTLNAEAQAVSDLRQTLAWIRQQNPSNIAVMGFSLGGLNTAMMAALEPDIDAAIAAVPLADITEIFWYQAPDIMLKAFAEAGVDRSVAAQLFAPVSPLALPVALDPSKRFMLAGTGDVVIPPHIVNKLWEHWERPPMTWYQGSHMSVSHEKDAKACVRRVLNGIRAK